MKNLLIICLLGALNAPFALGQNAKGTAKSSQAIHDLVATYARARENQDSLLLKSILTDDIDQLVSTGEWRQGIKRAMAGMARSTGSNPGTRTLEVERLRYLTPQSAIADARYVLNNDDGTRREMWSTFAVVKSKGKWRISAIRNMLPGR